MSQSQDNHSKNRHSQNIPFLDLVTPHVELEAELTAVFQEVIRSAGFIGGPMVENFEKEFAAFCHTDRAVSSQQRDGCSPFRADRRRSVSRATWR